MGLSTLAMTRSFSKTSARIKDPSRGTAGLVRFHRKGEPTTVHCLQHGWRQSCIFAARSAGVAKFNTFVRILSPNGERYLVSLRGIECGRIRVYGGYTPVSLDFVTESNRI
jgi:hypothetical protein